MSKLYERAMGAYPLSIATSLAIESLYNRHPDRPKEAQLPALKAKTIWINLRTLFRNIYGSLPSEEARGVIPLDYADVIEDEIQNLRAILSTEEHPLDVVFYCPTYKGIEKEYGRGDLRPKHTDKQLAYLALENGAFEVLWERYGSLSETESPVFFVDCEIKTKTPDKAFFITHYPVDLLNTVGFDSVLLLESHTGVIKDKFKWNSKFHTKGCDRIPFNQGTLLFFGDSGLMFKPQPIKARRRVLEIAEEYKWDATTTRERIKLTLKLANEPFLWETLKALWD